MRRALVAEFASSEACCHAIENLQQQGFERLDVYMPYPSKEVQEALGTPPSPLPRYVFVAGLCGALLAYFILWYTNVYDFPINVGGHPDHAVPAFIPITFETLVLFAGCTSFIGALVLGRLPRLYHPIDEIEGFEQTSVDRFILTIDADDPDFEEARAETLLNEHGALAVRALGKSAPESGAKEEA